MSKLESSRIKKRSVVVESENDSESSEQSAGHIAGKEGDGCTVLSVRSADGYGHAGKTVGDG